VRPLAKRPRLRLLRLLRLRRSLAGLALAALAAVTTGALAADSPWSADRRLTSTSGAARLSINFARSMAADDAGGVHVVWYETRDGRAQVDYARSRDGGLTWDAARRLSSAGPDSEQPAIAVSGPDVYVVWHDLRRGKPDIFLRRSSDGGSTWGPETALTSLAGSGAYPSIAASGARVRAVWGSRDDGQAEVYTRGSADRGVTWSPARRISSLPYESWVATVEVSGPDAYVGWVDYRDANEEEYFRRSADGGRSWGPIRRLTRDRADSWAASIAVSGSILNLLWFDRRDAGVMDRDVENALDQAGALVGLALPPPPPRDAAVYYLQPFELRLQQEQQAIQEAAPGWVQRGGDPAALQTLLENFQALLVRWTYGWEIYAKRSTDRGLTWGPDTRLTRAPGLSLRPSVAASGPDVWTVWSDGRDGVQEVYAKHSPDDGLTWEPDERLTAAGGNPLDDTMHPSIAIGGGWVYVVWSDQRDGNPEIYFKRRAL
jgi:hypothetical protein